jgi:hypothetical protein
MTLVLVVKSVVKYNVVHATVPFQIVICGPTMVFAGIKVLQHRDGTLTHPTVTATEMEIALCLKKNAERNVPLEGPALKYVNYRVNPSVSSLI